MSRLYSVCEQVLVPVTGAMNDGSRLYHHESEMSVVDVANDSTTVYTGACVLLGIYVNTALSAHALPIVDGSTTKITIPASSAAGLTVLFPSARFETSLIVDPNDAATGNITVFYRKL